MSHGYGAGNSREFGATTTPTAPRRSSVVRRRDTKKGVAVPLVLGQATPFGICSAGGGDEDLTPLDIDRFTRLLRVLVYPPPSPARWGNVHEELDPKRAGEAAQRLEARIVLGCLEPRDC